jgi:hypothetical protein
MTGIPASWDGKIRWGGGTAALERPPSSAIDGYDTEARAVEARRPELRHKTDIGQQLGLGDFNTIDVWVAKGQSPPLHSQPGERHATGRHQ